MCEISYLHKVQNEIYADLGPYITAESLPAPLRTDPYAFDLLYPGESSDKAAANFLLSLLKEQDIKAELWTVITPNASKDVVIASNEQGMYRMLDPSSGIVPMYENQVVIGPYAARFMLMDHKDVEAVFIKLDENADLSFYEGFEHAMISPPNLPLYISVAAPVFEEPIVLGSIDGDSADVALASSDLDLTPFLDYLGRKHGDNVQRSIYFTDAAKVTLTLAQPYDADVASANLEPTVDGNTLVFEVPEGEPLVFIDKADAFIPVDQIIIEQL